MVSSGGDDHHTRATTPRAVEAVEFGSRLHALALRYWADDRPSDALRVALHAAELVGWVDPPPPLLSEITSTIVAIRDEVQADATPA